MRPVPPRRKPWAPRQVWVTGIDPARRTETLAAVAELVEKRLTKVEPATVADLPAGERVLLKQGTGGYAARKLRARLAAVGATVAVSPPLDDPHDQSMVTLALRWAGRDPARVALGVVEHFGVEPGHAVALVTAAPCRLGKLATDSAERAAETLVRAGALVQIF